MKSRSKAVSSPVSDLRLVSRPSTLVDSGDEIVLVPRELVFLLRVLGTGCRVLLGTSAFLIPWIQSTVMLFCLAALALGCDRWNLLTSPRSLVLGKKPSIGLFGLISSILRVSSGLPLVLHRFSRSRLVAFSVVSLV